MLKETVIRADETTLLHAHDVARRENRPVNDVIVEALEEYLERYQPKQYAPGMLPGFVGMLGSKEGNISEQVEDILDMEWARHLADEDAT